MHLTGLMDIVVPITFTFTFTHMMTRTLLGVMAIVQFSAKYLQCNVFCFFGVFLFFTFYLYYCYYFVTIKTSLVLKTIHMISDGSDQWILMADSTVG